MPSSSLNLSSSMADLAVINYGKLIEGDRKELKLLSSACQKHGFFYLELDDSISDDYLDLVASIFHDAKRYFAQPIEAKMRDCRKDTVVANVCGFKPLGTETGVVEDKKDGFEAFKEGCLTSTLTRETVLTAKQVPTDHIYKVGEMYSLQVIGLKTHLRRLSNFVELSEGICSTVMSALSDILEGEYGVHERLEKHHNPITGSDSVAVINHYPLADLPEHASVGHNAHTDMGSLTLLFCSDWGLQVYSSDRGRWEYVVPRPKSAIVNVGDSLRFLSGQKFKSCLHRVVPHETWKSKARYSVAYFLRPSRTEVLSDADGRRWTAEEWNVRKFKSYVESHAEQQKSSVQTGRMRFLGVWRGPSSESVQSTRQVQPDQSAKTLQNILPSDSL